MSVRKGGVEPHRTDPGHHGVDAPGVPAVVRQPLAEEKVDLAVVGVRTVRDQVGVHEDRLWKGRRGHFRGWDGEGGGVWRESSPLSHLELCWSVRTALRLLRLRKTAASVPMKSMYMAEKSS